MTPKDRWLVNSISLQRNYTRPILSAVHGQCLGVCHNHKVSTYTALVLDAFLGEKSNVAHSQFVRGLLPFDEWSLLIGNSTYILKYYQDSHTRRG